MKTYITWQTLWLNNQEGRHIDANVNLNWNYEGRPITCECLGYGRVPMDNRMLAIIEIPDNQYSGATINRFWKSIDVFASEQITPQEALDLCNLWYADSPLKEGKLVPFELDIDGFSLIDNRDDEVFM